MKKIFYFALACGLIHSGYGANLQTRDFLSPDLLEANQLTFPITYVVQTNFPTNDDRLYERVDSVSFFTNTGSNGMCEGTEHTLYLPDNQDISVGKLHIGGFVANTQIGQLNLHSGAIEHAAAELGVTLGSGGYTCAQIRIVYHTGSSASVSDIGPVSVAKDTGGVNPVFVLGGITVSQGKITTGTAKQAALDFVQDKGDLQFQDGSVVISDVNLASGTSKRITIKNTAYSALNSFSVSVPSAFSGEFTNNTCNATLSGQGATCSIDYSGRTIPGVGAIEASTSNGSQSRWLLPFVIHQPATTYCWGDNESGQLGNGTASEGESRPGQVIGLRKEVEAISTGGYHACALLSSGAMQCWGNNTKGQLGDGKTATRALPRPVSGLSSGVLGISAAEFHTCAVLTSGAVQCWGDNSFGQIGDGTKQEKRTPTPVLGLDKNVMQVAAGNNFTCALLKRGAVKCWGNNAFGQLGDGTKIERKSPAQVSGLTEGVIHIAAGVNYACALLNTGAVKCWGDNESGQLGDGTASEGETMPKQVVGLTGNIVNLSTGGYHVCAVLDTGKVECWGNNTKGQLGDGTLKSRGTPARVSGLATNIVEISSGDNFTCAVEDLGKLRCWGDNAFGELGNDTKESKSTPTLVLGNLAGVHIATGENFACALSPKP